MTWPVHRVTRVQVSEPWRLDLAFSDASEQHIDLEPALHGQHLGALRDPAAFGRVAIDDMSGGIRWPNGVRIDAHKLYHWPTEGLDWAATVRKLAARDRKMFTVLKWLFAASVALFAYSLATWAGLTEDQPYRPLTSVLISGAIVLNVLSSLVMRRSLKLVWAPLIASLVLLGFSVASMSARR